MLLSYCPWSAGQTFPSGRWETAKYGNCVHGFTDPTGAHGRDWPRVAEPSSRRLYRTYHS
jgi:hypothetical protein